MAISKKWEEPKYSKKRVDKAGDEIVKALHCQEDMDVFHNWRSAHTYPMQIMNYFLRDNSLYVDKNSIVVRRLKRAPSIIYKLRREPHMDLSRMEDIGGCRAILSTLNKVRELQDRLKNSSSSNILHRERDYITNPKTSGYRSVHLIYGYNGEKDKFVNMKVELQIRTKIQHSWATAVEVIDTFTGRSLKSGEGEEKWLRFFKLISIEFEKLESDSIRYDFNKDNFYEISNLVEELKIFDRLRMFTMSIHAITRRLKPSKKGVYFLIDLDIASMSGTYSIYSNNKFNEATNHYNKLDESCQTSNNRSIVLVSAKSLSELKTGYPNYFADTRNFEENVKKVFEIYKLV
jgi:relA/spoT domain protein